MTTQDAATQLQVSRSRIRQLALDGQLRFQLTTSGQFLFDQAEIHRFQRERAEARTRSRDVRLRAVRLQMVKAEIYEPRQLEIVFGGRAKARCAIAQ